jgi:HD-GYP domain-containing protein (c-di-GMP phosphodiesterase class II)
MSNDVQRLLKREGQLNALSYVVILGLLAVAALLTFMVITRTDVPGEWWLLQSDAFRVLSTGLLLMVILYLIDQHRRLRTALLESHHELETARDETQSAYDRLAFSHHAAEIMTSLAEEDGLRRVLIDSLAHFEAEAAAVVGDDIEMITLDDVDSERANQAILEAALETVRAGTPLSIGTQKDGSTAIAVPLRIRGQLRSVVCLWRRAGEFPQDQLDGLGLVARIIELGMENRMLLEDTESRLQGTLRAMVDLVESRRPNYIPHSTLESRFAVAVGHAMGMREEELADLRLAAMLQDVGMLQVPEAVLEAPRPLSAEEHAEMHKHARLGADLAQVANFGPRVQQAILSHHERLDGSGYPDGLKGDEIPVAARVLAVCDAYVAMTSNRPHRARMSSFEALAELRAKSGTDFDPRIVREFMRAHSAGIGGPEPAAAPTMPIFMPESLFAMQKGA